MKTPKKADPLADLLSELAKAGLHIDGKPMTPVQVVSAFRMMQDETRKLNATIEVLLRKRWATVTG